MGIWGGYDKYGRMPITPHKTFMLKGCGHQADPSQGTRSIFQSKASRSRVVPLTEKLCPR